MQTATSETESKSLDLSICVHHYTLRAPCPKGQGNGICVSPPVKLHCAAMYPFCVAARPAMPARLLAIPYFSHDNPLLGATRARHPSVVLLSPSEHLVLPVLPAPLGEGRSVTFGIARAGWAAG